jgi:murein DD-endopeptidase MepM/ murein hydrolase activator NlpD
VSECVSRAVAVLALLLLSGHSAAAARLDVAGQAIQGGLLRGVTEPGTRLSLDGASVTVTPEGEFIIGFGRDAKPHAELVAEAPDGSRARLELAVEQRQYLVQRIDGLPQETVTPDAAAQEQILRDAAAVKAARATLSAERGFAQVLTWPALGPISGVYGSQRILNGEPRSPHYGVDIAVPQGTPVTAAADGVVTLATPFFLTGNTVIIDHGYRFSTVYAHLARLDVRPGDHVRQGQAIGTVGATGRVTAPHLHWGADWGDVRLDPLLLAGPMPPRP